MNRILIPALAMIVSVSASAQSNTNLLGSASSATLPPLEVPADIRILSNPNMFALQATSIEGDEYSIGVSYYRDITISDRAFISFEHGEFDSSESGFASGLFGESSEEITSNEIEAGYLRRVSNPDNFLGLFVGGSIGVDFQDATVEESVSDGRSTARRKYEITPDPMLNVYVDAMADISIVNNVKLFSLFSYGFNFGVSGEIEETSNFAYPEKTTFEENETTKFWNLSLGIMIAL